MDDDFSRKLQKELSVLRPFHGDCTFEPMLDEDGVQASSGLDWRGRELPDGTPLAPPVGFSQGPSLVDFIHRTIRNQLSRAAEDAGLETEEEADDFEVGDDFDPNVRFFEDAYQPFPAVEPEAAAPVAASPGAAPASDPSPPRDAGSPPASDLVPPSPATPASGS